MTVKNKFVVTLLILVIAGVLGIAQVTKAETTAATKKPVQEAAAFIGPRGGAFITPGFGFHNFGGFFPNTFVRPFGFGGFFPNTFVTPFGFHNFGGFFATPFGFHGGFFPRF